MTAEEFISHVRDQHSQCCLTDRCEDQGCELRLDGLDSGALAIIGGSGYQARHNYRDRLCDFILFIPGPGCILCAVELKGGSNLDPHEVLKQVQDGLNIASEMLGDETVDAWRPIVLFDKEGLRQQDVRYLNANHVEFRNERKNLERKDCGSLLTDILTVG